MAKLLRKAPMPEAEEEEAAGEAAAYEVWFRHKVQEALDSPVVYTHEEVEAEAALWRAEIGQQMADKARRVVGEAGLEASGEG